MHFRSSYKPKVDFLVKDDKHIVVGIHWKQLRVRQRNILYASHPRFNCFIEQLVAGFRERKKVEATGVLEL